MHKKNLAAFASVRPNTSNLLGYFAPVSFNARKELNRVASVTTNGSTVFFTCHPQEGHLRDTIVTHDYRLTWLADLLNHSILPTFLVTGYCLCEA